MNSQQAERLIAALERIAVALEAQAPPTRARMEEDARYQRSVAILKEDRARRAAAAARLAQPRTNAIAGPATGRGLIK